MLRWYVRRGIGGKGSRGVGVNVVLLWTGGQGHARAVWDELVVIVLDAGYEEVDTEVVYYAYI
jgi:hypothetical protein